MQSDYCIDAIRYWCNQINAIRSIYRYRNIGMYRNIGILRQSNLAAFGVYLSSITEDECYWEYWLSCLTNLSLSGCALPFSFLLSFFPPFLSSPFLFPFSRVSFSRFLAAAPLNNYRKNPAPRGDSQGGGWGYSHAYILNSHVDNYCSGRFSTEFLQGQLLLKPPNTEFPRGWLLLMAALKLLNDARR